MIDIHNHILPNVDDGSISLDTSIFLLKEAKKNGIKKIICTPHHRKKMFETATNKIIEEYNVLKEKAKEFGIDLYLGQEIRCNKYADLLNYIQKKNVLSMNYNNILLLEFSYSNDPDINEIIYHAKIKGYKVIIAHIERYSYLTFEDIYNLKQSGAYIQVNAESVVGINGSKIKKLIKKLIKEDLVDFVASDMHYNREVHYLDAYNYILKKFGKLKADKLFNDNAEDLLIK